MKDDYFNEYIVSNNTTEKEKAIYWKMAIGLQDVDRLKVSDYLLSLAEKNIKGENDFAEIHTLLNAYYEEKQRRQEIEKRTEEADKVASNMTEILQDNCFNLSVLTLLNIHKRLFSGVFSFAGDIRDVNITKREFVLNGDTVLYENYPLIYPALEYDIQKEKKFDYNTLSSKNELVNHISSFVSGIWQIHPFREGNTRTVATFTILYLRSLGFKEVNNDLFSKYSFYFRNALVRSNYTNLIKGITANNIGLNKFFSSLLFNESITLRNRDLIIEQQCQEKDEEARNTR